MADKLSFKNLEVDGLVTIRGEIAHRGRDAKYVKINQLIKYGYLMRDAAIEIDNFISDFLCEYTEGNRKPWRKTS